MLTNMMGVIRYGQYIWVFTLESSNSVFAKYIRRWCSYGNRYVVSFKLEIYKSQMQSRHLIASTNFAKYCMQKCYSTENK